MEKKMKEKIVNGIIKVLFLLIGLYYLFNGIFIITSAEYITQQAYGILSVLVGVVALGFTFLFDKLDKRK